ncbi:multidrug effflux MFS transporter [Chitinophaga agrisoli]|uniref:Multidrug effflux MFS transporter n=1 Tax=Chitinophaga agrisoli TaxID=2607653 RepID=A0A5B2VR86_9BACT|nr:MFS transporter [Chitinophaga agrisoli]KAA2241721.1 multidrug effflux MFS transporter [Chitinophaga agrisoli]
MKTIKAEHHNIATVLSFALIPLSGFATDVYLPSLPAMATSLHVNNAAIQLSLLVFMVSAGISQLFVGSLLDSFGRYRLSNLALLAFALSNFVTALYPDIYVLYGMRIIQGVTVALIVVAKRAYFMDTFSGEKLKHYTSLFSIIWATAPIVAPFIGGYLQASFGWESNFWFMGGFTLLILLLTLIYGGESIKQLHAFEVKAIVNVYGSMLKTKDYSLSLMIIGLNYGMLMVFGMASPFIIEHVYHASPVITGYSALMSGVALMTGGIISKAIIAKPLIKKITVAIGLQLAVALIMIACSTVYLGLYVMMGFVILLHLIAGFIFNNMFSYSLGRFSRNAGIVSGLTGGGLYVITSFFSYGTVSILAVKSQVLLGMAYLVLVLMSVWMFAWFRKASVHIVKEESVVKAAA